MESVDQITGIENREFARLSKKQNNDELVVAEKIALVGFWNKKINANYKCYHHFVVPMPVVRSVLEVDKTILNQFLFVGNRFGPGQPGDIFMFYEQNIENTT